MIWLLMGTDASSAWLWLQQRLLPVMLAQLSLLLTQVLLKGGLIIARYRWLGFRKVLLL